MNALFSLPIAAVPTIAPAFGLEALDPVIDRAEAALVAYNAAIDAETIAEDAAIDWLHANPRPTLRACVVGTGADYDAFRSGTSTFDPNADLKAAVAEHEVAIRKWGEQKRAAASSSGIADATRLVKFTHSALQEALSMLCDAVPTTVAGLRAKAQAATDLDDYDCTCR